MSQINNLCDSCVDECPTGGCSAWRRWFVENWNENIYIGPKPKIREVFQYEHPDREREMAPKEPEEMTAAEWMAAKMPSELLRGGRYNPCNGCPDRYIACSDHCQKPEYLGWLRQPAEVDNAENH